MASHVPVARYFAVTFSHLHCSTWMRGKSGLKRQNNPKLPRTHAKANEFKLTGILTYYFKNKSTLVIFNLSKRGVKFQLLIL